MTPDIKARLREVEHWLRALPNSQGAWADDVQDALATIEALEGERDTWRRRAEDAEGRIGNALA